VVSDKRTPSVAIYATVPSPHLYIAQSGASELVLFAKYNEEERGRHVACMGRSGIHIGF
jgi:hypothetical protein